MKIKQLLFFIFAISFQYARSMENVGSEQSSNLNASAIASENQVILKPKITVSVEDLNTANQDSSSSTIESSSDTKPAAQISQSSSDVMVMTETLEEQKAKHLQARKLKIIRDELRLQGIPIDQCSTISELAAAIKNKQLTNQKASTDSKTSDIRTQIRQNKHIAKYLEREKDQKNKNKKAQAVSAQNSLQKESVNWKSFKKNIDNKNLLLDFQSFSQSSYLAKHQARTKNVPAQPVHKFKSTTLETIISEINNDPLRIHKARSIAVERFKSKHHVALSLADLMIVNSFSDRVYSHGELLNLRKAGVNDAVLTVDKFGMPCVDGKMFFEINYQGGIQKSAKLITEFEYSQKAASIANDASSSLARGKQILEQVKGEFKFTQLTEVESLLADYGEGLLGSTQIKTDRGYHSIQDVKVGDTVFGYDVGNKQEIQRKVTYVGKVNLKKHIQITIDDKTLRVACGHKFYIKSQDKWVKAKELKNDLELRKLVDPNIQDVKEVRKDLELIQIGVDDQHNFYITDHDILVHNFSPALLLEAKSVGEAIWGFVRPTLTSVGNNLLQCCGIHFGNADKIDKKQIDNLLEGFLTPEQLKVREINSTFEGIKNAVHNSLERLNQENGLTLSLNNIYAQAAYCNKVYTSQEVLKFRQKGVKVPILTLDEANEPYLDCDLFVEVAHVDGKPVESMITSETAFNHQITSQGNMSFDAASSAANYYNSMPNGHLTAYQKAVQKLQDEFDQIPVISHPDFPKPFIDKVYNLSEVGQMRASGITAAILAVDEAGNPYIDGKWTDLGTFDENNNLISTEPGAISIDTMRNYSSSNSPSSCPCKKRTVKKISSHKRTGNQNNDKEQDSKGRRIPPPIGPGKSKNNEEKRKFVSAPYHHQNSSGWKSSGPKNGQTALDNSIEFKTKGNNENQRRLGISEGEFVVFDGTSDGTFHGHVRTWQELNPKMRSALIKSKLVKADGTII